MSNELTHGACAIFKSPIHGNRPVVFAGAGREKKAQLFDYTIANTWEESKHDFSLIKSTVKLGNKERFDKEQIGIRNLYGLPTLLYHKSTVR